MYAGTRARPKHPAGVGVGQDPGEGDDSSATDVVVGPLTCVIVSLPVA